MPTKDEERRKYKGIYNRFMMQPAKISTTGFVRLYVLYMLTEKKDEMYGLEMIEQIKKDFAHVSRWKPNSSVMYPILKRLSNQGYLAYYKEDPTTNSRKYYKITRAGKQYYREQKDKYQPIFNEAISMLELAIDEIYGG
jgi:PadR family transcriptional regulator PadR